MPSRPRTCCGGRCAASAVTSPWLSSSGWCCRSARSSWLWSAWLPETSSRPLLGPRRGRRSDVSARGSGSCSVEGCDGVVDTRGMCSAHYRRHLHTGEVGPAQVRRRARGPRPCAVSGCHRQVLAHDLCRAHYERLTRTGAAGPAPIVTRRRYEPDARCSTVDCAEPPHSGGNCKRHYDQRRRLRPGSPPPPS